MISYNEFIKKKKNKDVKKEGRSNSRLHFLLKI